jgi:hypothetical protein
MSLLALEKRTFIKLFSHLVKEIKLAGRDV